ncbi:hypothetical protein AB0T83_18045 [Fluviibacterium sp. DFM31]|uniref:Uncharacterized protein n=1 Tax=Meridianimarinicoccus marinus TaxID=3231483 RepID=A0ABV3LAS0_9RHOB
MHSKILIGLSIAAASAVCANTHRFTGSATCKLTNTAADAGLYEGPRTVTQSETEYSTIFEVKMGGAESFLFAGKKGDPNWMHGPDRVRFTDLPTRGIFHWSTFALVVAQ